jgi:hypothetical protein
MRYASLNRRPSPADFGQVCEPVHVCPASEPKISVSIDRSPIAVALPGSPACLRRRRRLNRAIRASRWQSRYSRSKDFVMVDPSVDPTDLSHMAASNRTWKIRRVVRRGHSGLYRWVWARPLLNPQSHISFLPILFSIWHFIRAVSTHRLASRSPVFDFPDHSHRAGAVYLLR